MATPRSSNAAAPAAAAPAAAAPAPVATSDGVVPKSAEQDDGGGYSLDSIGVSITPDGLEYMRDCLDGKRPQIGPNLAVMGFYAKSPTSQLIGVVRAKTRAPNRLNPENESVVCFVEGLCRYPQDVVNADTGEVKIKAGDYTGVFGLQLDAGTASFDTEEIVGSRVHLQVEKRALLASGLKRYQYVFARVAPATTAAR